MKPTHQGPSSDYLPPAGTGYPQGAGYPPSSDSSAYPLSYPGGPAGPSRDPLIPADFSGWFSRIFEVARRNFPQLAVLAIIPAAISLAQQLVIMSQLPSQSELQRMISQQGASPNPLALFEMVIGNMLPVVIAFMILSAIAAAWVQAASMSLAIRGSNGQHMTVGAALRFAMYRVPAVIVWSIVAGFAVMIGFVLTGPGAPVGHAALAALGVLLAIALAVYLAVTFTGSLLGVIVVERRGITRCFALIKNRWWATFGRLASIGVLAAGYVLVLTVVASILSGVTSSPDALTGASSNLSSGTVIVAVIEAALMIPIMVILMAVFTVTYAELRFHENNAVTTTSLAAELDGQ
jgi:hypothetical protein